MNPATWMTLMKVYSDVFTSTKSISSVTASKFSIRSHNSSDQWTFHLYAHDPNGSPDNKILIAASDIISLGTTDTTVAVHPSYNIIDSGAIPGGYRLMLEISCKPGGTMDMPQVYFDSAGDTTESYVRLTQH